MSRTRSTLPPRALLTRRAPRRTQISELPARDLVPGDVVELRVGDKARRWRGGARQHIAALNALR